METTAFVLEDLMIRHRVKDGSTRTGRILKLKERGGETPLVEPFLVEVPPGENLKGCLVRLGILSILETEGGIAIKGRILSLR